MLVTVLLALFAGISLGFLGAILFLRTIKIKCPKCKQLRPLKEIIIFQWKSRQITGQACQRCQRPKPQIDIF